MKIISNKLRVAFVSVVAILAVVLSMVFSPATMAAEEGFSFALSPMEEKIVLNPGDEYTSSLRLYTTTEFDTGIEYQILVVGYYVDESYNNIYEECTDERCEMAKWIKIESPLEGRLSPGEEVTIKYTINVPKDAPGGGQYASIIVRADRIEDESDTGEDGGNGAKNVKSAIKEIRRIAYTIYAEIAGNIVRQGEITNTSVPSFLLSGDITGSSSVKNTGNVHGEAKYKLQVFPLFSDEEIYTNEEKPVGRTVLPDRTLYNEITWPNTPTFGIYNVVYTVEFEGVTAQVKKMVIKCPVWLLFIVIFAVISLVIWLILQIKRRREAARE
jgi:hypothetical protein